MDKMCDKDRSDESGKTENICHCCFFMVIYKSNLPDIIYEVKITDNVLYVSKTIF